MDEKHENKSQLAKDLANALFVCRLRDGLSNLVEDSTVREAVDDVQFEPFTTATSEPRYAKAIFSEGKQLYGQSSTN